MRRNVLLQRKAGLLGFDSRLVRDTYPTIVLGFQGRANFPLEVGNGRCKPFRCRFVLSYQPRLFLTGHDAVT
jgi:hypothetical protein